MLFSVMKVLVFVPLFWRQISWAITPSQTALLILGGGLGAAAFLLIVKAIKRLELSTVTPLLALEPGLVALLAAGILRETISGLALLGLILLLVGTYILELQHEPPGWWQLAAGSRTRALQPFTAILKRPGGWYAVIGLMAFTISALVSRRVLLEVPVNTYLAYDFVIVALIYIVLTLRSKRRIALLQAGQKHLLWVILILALLHIAQSVSQATAIKLAPIALVIAVKRISVLLDVTVGGRLFHEHRLPQKFIAATIMILGTYLIVIS